MRDVIDDHSYNVTNYKITAQEISEFLRGDASAGMSLLWRPLITGQVDADRADYLLRDSIHCGVAYGRYDLERILVTLTLARDENDNPVIAIEEGGWHAAEGLILARYMMFTQVYFHQTRRAYDYHIAEVMRYILLDSQKRTAFENKSSSPEASSFPPPTSKKNIARYAGWNQGAALSIHKETALGTSLATVRRVGPNQVPPKRALPMAPSAACHSQSTPSNSSHPSTRAPHIRCKTPALKGAMNGAVVPKLFRQSVPLAPAAQPEDDAVEHWVRALAAPGFGRVFLQDDRFDPLLVRYFPERPDHTAS